MMQDARLHASALADRLIFGGEATFLREDAADLLALLPKPGLLRRLALLLPGIGVRGEMPSLGASGVAAGVGQLRMEGDKIKFDLDSQGRVCLRAGQWRIYREDSLLPGRIRVVIEQVMANVTDEGRKAAISYRKGKPTEMRIYRNQSVSLGFLTVVVSADHPWKAPA